MKRVLLILSFFASMVLAINSAFAQDDIEEQIKLALYWVGETCSGVAISPDLLFSAGHCNFHFVEKKGFPAVHADDENKSKKYLRAEFHFDNLYGGDATVFRLLQGNFTHYISPDWSDPRTHPSRGGTFIVATEKLNSLDLPEPALQPLAHRPGVKKVKDYLDEAFLDPSVLLRWYTDRSMQQMQTLLNAPLFSYSANIEASGAGGPLVRLRRIGNKEELQIVGIQMSALLPSRDVPRSTAFATPLFSLAKRLKEQQKVRLLTELGIR